MARAFVGKERGDVVVREVRVLELINNVVSLVA
jgi:hypothetical protein